MSSRIISSSFSKDYLPGIQKWTGLDFRVFEPMHPKFTTVQSTSMRYDEDAMLVGLGMPQVKPEGQAGLYDGAAGQNWVRRYEQIVYTLQFILTWEAQTDLQTLDLAKSLSIDARKNIDQYKDMLCTNIVNGGFTSNTVSNGGDQVALFSTAHTTKLGGTYANYLSTPVTLSEAGIETMAILGKAQIDERGNKKIVMLDTLMTHPNNEFTAKRILKSILRVGVSDNDPNVIRMDNTIKDLVINPFMTSTTAWVATTDVGNGVKMFVHTDLAVSGDDDFDVDASKFKLKTRVGVGATNPRGIMAGNS